MRRAVKGLVETVLVGSGFPRRAIERRTRDLAILAYHNVVPRGERAAGDRSLHIPQAAFGEHLDRLGETHRFVSLEEAFDRDQAGPRAVITFDDGYAGALSAGMEELKSRDLPATVFVNPGALEWEGFWWDRLADPGSGELPASIREHALRRLGGMQEHVLAWARSQGLAVATVPEHARPASLDRLMETAAWPRITLASHTWEHTCLPEIPGDRALDQVERSLSWLRARFAKTSDWIAYPYGMSSPAVRDLASRFHRGGLLVTGGIVSTVRSPSDLFQVPRLNIPSGLTREGLVLRLAGWVAPD